MPAYKRKSKYTPAQTQEITMEALDVLANSPVALTISEICLERISLAGQTTQKMARCLNTLVDWGMVEKAKSKSGRMLYMATSQLQAQGYRKI